jgi:hypothetical protein
VNGRKTRRQGRKVYSNRTILNFSRAVPRGHRRPGAKGKSNNKFGILGTEKCNYCRDAKQKVRPIFMSPAIADSADSAFSRRMKRNVDFV